MIGIARGGDNAVRSILILTNTLQLSIQTMQFYYFNRIFCAFPLIN